MDEFGGFLPLELPQKNKSFFSKYNDVCVQTFDCARNALAFICLCIQPRKIHIPFYNCEMVVKTLIKYGIPYEQYYLSEDFTPNVESVNQDEWLLCVNYFGKMSDRDIAVICEQYNRVIFDNTQAFFCKPIIKPDCFNIYSCRKFFGVADGAYMVSSWNQRLQEKYMELPMSKSWSRAAFLMRSIEEGTNAAYLDSIRNEEKMGTQISKMSCLTERILNSIDYKVLKEKRVRNLKTLVKELEAINQFTMPINFENMMIYPFYFESSDLRKKLIENNIYVPQWWKYLINKMPKKSVEYKYSQWLYPLPIDQRYEQEDMVELALKVKMLIKGELYI